MKSKRMVIYYQDIMRITAKSERYAQYMMQKMRIHYNRTDRGYITIKEFCAFFQFKEEDVLPYII